MISKIEEMKTQNKSYSLVLNNIRIAKHLEKI